jgi:mono/diheme cytochrome c family protein
VTAGGRRYVHYMKPIVIAAPVCLQCHGAPDKLAPGVADALKELYPQDQATGYVGRRSPRRGEREDPDRVRAIGRGTPQM